MSALRHRAGVSRGDGVAPESRPRIRKRGGLTRRLAAASAALACLVASALVVVSLAIGDLSEAERRTRHSQGVLIAATEVERGLLDLETGQRGFVLTRDEAFLAPWHSARGMFPGRIAALTRLAAGNPVTAGNAARIARDVRAYITGYSVPLVAAARRGDASARSVATALEGKRQVDALRVELDALLNGERGASARASASARSAARQASGVAAAALVASVALIAIYASYLRRAIVSPVRGMAVMAGRVAGGDLTARMPETGPGEVGVLEHTFNVMAGSLEQSSDDLAELVAEQSALRRVATLVARGAPPDAVFAAVVEEVRLLLDAELTVMNRYDGDDAATIVAASRRGRRSDAVGSSVRLGGRNITTRMRETRAPQRMAYAEASGNVRALAEGAGLHAAVGAPISVEDRLWGVIVAAAAGEEQLPPGTEDRLGDFTELVATAIANAESQAELRASRARVVATADETRRRIERDLHDGAQQRLVTLALMVRGAQTAAPPELGALRSELDDIAGGLTDVLDDLRELARGIHPAILAEGGLGPALRTLARRSPVPVHVDVRAEGRLPEPIEVGAYFVISEALTNAAKHAHASAVDVEVEAVDGILRLRVADDGVGGADLGRGTGLVGLKDRVEALGGRIAVRSTPGEGTAIRAELPLGGRAGGISSGG